MCTSNRRQAQEQAAKEAERKREAARAKEAARLKEVERLQTLPRVALAALRSSDCSGALSIIQDMTRGYADIFSAALKWHAYSNAACALKWHA